MLKAYHGKPRLGPRKASSPSPRRHETDALTAMFEREAGGMNLSTRPPILEMLPEVAPFTPEQRAWLNGFFAGLLRLDGAGDAAVGGGSRRADAGPAGAVRPAPAGGDADDGAAWHDPALPTSPTA